MSAQIAGASGAPTGGPPATEPEQPVAEPPPRCSPFANHAAPDAVPDPVLTERARAGDAEALDVVFRRHWQSLHRCAQRVCGDPFAAEDILQEACVKAVANIPRLPAGADFRLWVTGFIHNEARHWKRNLKKVGTPALRVGIYILESMNVEANTRVGEDALDLLGLLAQESKAMAGVAALTAASMLQYLTTHEKLPPVRSIAAAAQLTQGTAERARQGVLHCWRRRLSGEFVRR